MAENDSIQGSFFGVWIKQELVARATRPATNEFEKGRLEAILIFYHMIGGAEFDQATRTAVTKLNFEKEVSVVQERIILLKWICDGLKEASAKLDLSEYEIGYLHALLGIAELAARPEDPLDCKALKNKLLNSAKILEWDSRFDWKTRTLTRPSKQLGT
jgi:hypothetical protein